MGKSSIGACKICDFYKSLQPGGCITLDILLQPTLFLSGSVLLQCLLSFSCTPVDILTFLSLHHVTFICLPDVHDTNAGPAYRLFFGKHKSVLQVKDKVAEQ